MIKILKKILLGFWVILLLLAAFKRLESQNQDRTVELCISWRETQDLIEREPSFLGDSPRTAFLNFLERSHIIGVHTVGLQEETLKSLAAQGKVIFFGAGEIEKLKSLGQGVPETLKPNLLWVKNDEPLAERMAACLSSGITKRKAGEKAVFENPMGAWETESNLNVGLNRFQLDTL